MFDHGGGRGVGRHRAELPDGPGGRVVLVSTLVGRLPQDEGVDIQVVWCGAARDPERAVGELLDEVDAVAGDQVLNPTLCPGDGERGVVERRKQRRVGGTPRPVRPQVVGVALVPEADEAGDPLHEHLDDHVGVVHTRVGTGSGMVVDLHRHHPSVEQAGVLDRQAVEERGGCYGGGRRGGESRWTWWTMRWKRLAGWSMSTIRRAPLRQHCKR